MVDRVCEQCGAAFRAKQQQVDRGHGRYCSRGCRDLAARNPDRPTEQPCAQCGERFSLVGRDLPAPYCSPACYWRSKEKPIHVQACVVCGRTREYRSWEHVGPYCSRACSARGRDQRESRACATCGQTFLVHRYRLAAGSGRYCSRGCAARRGRQAVERACPQCGRLRRFPPSAADRKYCSRRCYFEVRRRGRQTYTCVHCSQPFSVPPSGAPRKYCSWRCFARHHRPERVRCRACRQAFVVPAWRGARYCSTACSNRGRRRAPSPEQARIVALHGQGLRAPQIRAQLLAEGISWAAGEPKTTEAAIRQIVSRARRGGHERTVTLRREGAPVARAERST